MAGGFAKIAPHRLYRGPEGNLSPPGHGARCASVCVVIRTAGMKFSRYIQPHFVAVIKV